LEFTHIQQRGEAAITGDLEQENLMMKRRQLQWFGQVIRWKNSLANTILQGKTDYTRKRGRPVRCCIDNIKQMDWNALYAVD